MIFTPDFNSKTKKYTDIIEKELYSYMPKAQNGQDTVCEAMLYSIKNGGKRIRPLLTLELCNICGGDIKTALPFACAAEMIHTYSLIHDDLPCMDDDDMRRGKPSCHIAYGEEYALLAGDALLNLAFETLLEAISRDNSPNIVKAALTLAKASGIGGMIGGQTIDLQSENKKISLEKLRVMDKLKTGALIEASCKMGCLAADAEDEFLQAASSFAENLGLAFQITDDILDVTGDESVLGKPVGSDTENEKSTYVSLLGFERASEYARELTQKAISALRVFGDKADYLAELADYLCKRKY